MFANEGNIFVETPFEENCEYIIIGKSKEKKQKNTEEQKINGIISTIVETKKRNIGNISDHEQVCNNYICYYVKDRGNEFKIVCMENSMVIMIEEKIYFGPFWVLSDNIIAKNIAKLKLAHVRGFNYFCLMTPKQRVLV